MNKTKVKMNKPVYIGLSILDTSKLCYMDAESFTVHVKIKDVYADLTEDIEKRFGTSNYEVCRPLSIGRN